VVPIPIKGSFQKQLLVPSSSVEGGDQVWVRTREQGEIKPRSLGVMEKNCVLKPVTFQTVVKHAERRGKRQPTHWGSG